jgi:pimeloyl-ACP methyl ester carboxylesterase
MAYADNKGVRIHYRVEGNGPPLVLQHGYSDSLESWYEFGYVEPLKSERQVILVDARGHGASDKPHDPSEYTRELQAADIVAVLQNLSISRADYWGYSMGGQIGFAMAQYAPDWVRGLVIGGAAGAGLSRAGDRFLAALEARGAGAIPALWGIALSPTLQARLLANDVEALKACRADSPGFANLLSTIAKPCVLYAGSADPNCATAEAAAAKMPNASFFTVPGLGHAEVMFRSELVLPRVVEFLNSLEKRDTIPRT